MQKDSMSAPKGVPNTDPGFKVPGASAPASVNAPVDRPGLTTTPPGDSTAASAGALANTNASVNSDAGVSPSASGAAAPSSMEIAPGEGAPATDTSARELAIGGGVFVVLMVVFFFVRNAWTHHLVVRRVAPSAAGSAGWLLFVGLSFVSAAAVLALINASKFLNFAMTGTLVVVGIVSLIGAVLVGRR